MTIFMFFWSGPSSPKYIPNLSRSIPNTSQNRDPRLPKSCHETVSNICYFFGSVLIHFGLPLGLQRAQKLQKRPPPPPWRSKILQISFLRSKSLQKVPQDSSGVPQVLQKVPKRSPDDAKRLPKSATKEALRTPIRFRTLEGQLSEII